MLLFLGHICFNLSRTLSIVPCARVGGWNNFPYFKQNIMLDDFLLEVSIVLQNYNLSKEVLKFANVGLYIVVQRQRITGG